MSRDPLEGLLSLDDPGAGPALPIAHGDAERLVEAALAQAFAGGDGGTSHGEEASPPPQTAAGAPLVGAATIAKAVLLATLALGGGASLVRRQAPSPTEGHAVAPAPVMEPPLAAAAPGLVALDESVIVVDAGAQALASGKAGVRGRVPGAVVMPEVVLSDHELLGAANTARRERRWREADALYSKVVEAFPSSSVAAVAAIASGELRLDLLGDAGGARERFRFATTRGEAHAVDAYEGLLKACSALRDAACEREALAALEARHAVPKEKTTPP
jgi:hypothetical protein